MKLTKEQKEELIAKLNTPWGYAELLCDGVKVSLQVQRWKGLSYRVVTFVNGQFKGEWMLDKNQHPEQKFMRRSERLVCSPKERAQAEKALGKRYVAKSPFYTGKIVTYYPDWASGRAAIEHLCRVCERIEIIEASGA